MPVDELVTVALPRPGKDWIAPWTTFAGSFHWNGVCVDCPPYETVHWLGLPASAFRTIHWMSGVPPASTTVAPGPVVTCTSVPIPACSVMLKLNVSAPVTGS